MNKPAAIGHNNPPDPIDVALEPFDAVLIEAENWMDGATVENEAQLKATDVLLKELKAARKAVDTARDDVTKPLHEAWKAEIARWKPTQDDLDRQVKCLVAAQAPYKARLEAEKLESLFQDYKVERMKEEKRKKRMKMAEKMGEEGYD